MSDPRAFYQTVQDTVKNFNYWMQQITLLKDRLDSDAGLAAAAATAAQAAGRADLATVDFTNLNSAIGQVTFTFSSGAPTQKSYFYKML